MARLLLPLALLLLLLPACGGPRGDWREEVGRPYPDPVVLRPARPLEIPAALDLPPPGGASRALG